ncbi:MAG: ECF RNA polymerase sigma factor SigW [Tenericutes bacterium ADurb.BinA155]|jgi:RNA polymerase sigma-70 factor, ECF subfamily|nr:MAG: ECF RNA polymerase sigma factor SigW [Tenericutes bacterium ADurb.BinA155]
MKEEKLEKAVVRLREGDSNALAEIYEITSRGVFTFVLPILHDYQLAEDVMQQTFVTAYENIQSYQPGTNARNWLLTIAKNMALTEIKKRKREVSYDFDQDNHPDGVYFLGNIDSPTIALANKVLAEDEFNIVIMYAVGEYKHREIAEFLHMPLGTVTWKYNNALKKMRKALEENQTSYEREQAKAKI